MKPILLLIAAIGLTHSSCRKPESANAIPVSLNGSWRMILVKDNHSGFSVTKPSSVSGDVDITFTTINSAAGTFDGNTPTNEIQSSKYITGTNQTLTIPALSMTKVEETSWGKAFVDNIRSAQQYIFESSGKLNIKTAAKTLTFERE